MGQNWCAAFKSGPKHLTYAAPTTSKNYLSSITTSPCGRPRRLISFEWRKYKAICQ